MVLLGQVVRTAADFYVAALVAFAEEVLAPGLLQGDEFSGRRYGEAFRATPFRRQGDLQIERRLVECGQVVAEDQVGVADQELRHHRLNDKEKNNLPNDCQLKKNLMEKKSKTENQFSGVVWMFCQNGNMNLFFGNKTVSNIF